MRLRHRALEAAHRPPTPVLYLKYAAAFRQGGRRSTGALLTPAAAPWRALAAAAEPLAAATAAAAWPRRRGKPRASSTVRRRRRTMGRRPSQSPSLAGRAAPSRQRNRSWCGCTIYSIPPPSPYAALQCGFAATCHAGAATRSVLLFKLMVEASPLGCCQPSDVADSRGHVELRACCRQGTRRACCCLLLKGAACGPSPQIEDPKKALLLYGGRTSQTVKDVLSDFGKLKAVSPPCRPPRLSLAFGGIAFSWNYRYIGLLCVNFLGLATSRVRAWLECEVCSSIHHCVPIN